jgi:hypothetical protein
MGKAPILLLLVLAGYIGFELYALHRTSYRIEPAYIFDQFLSAHHAVVKCGNPGPGQLEQFRRNLRSVAGRAAEALRGEYPEQSLADIEAMINERSRQREREVDAIIEAGGCADPQIKTLLKRFEIRARLRVG